AKAIGLLNDVVDPEDLETAGQALAERIASFAPLAVRLSKSAFHAPREAHPLIDNVAKAVLFESQEKFARMDAFLSKREAKKAKKAAAQAAAQAAEAAAGPAEAGTAPADEEAAGPADVGTAPADETTGPET